MTACWNGAVDEVGEVLLVAAHGVEQQVLRDPLGRVGQLAAAAGVDGQADLLEEIDDRHDLADGERLVGDEDAQLVHALQDLGVLDDVGRVALDQHLDDARAGQALVRHAEAVDGRVALEELRAPGCCRPRGG